MAGAPAATSSSGVSNTGSTFAYDRSPGGGSTTTYDRSPNEVSMAGGYGNNDVAGATTTTSSQAEEPAATSSSGWYNQDNPEGWNFDAYFRDQERRSAAMGKSASLAAASSFVIGVLMMTLAF